MIKIFTVLFVFLCLNCFSQITQEPKFKNENLPIYLAYGGGLCLLTTYGMVLANGPYPMTEQRQVNTAKYFMFSGIAMVTVSVSIMGRREKIRKKYNDYLSEKTK